MRFFLKIKQNGNNMGQRRIEAKQEMTTTDQLINFISKTLNIQNYGFSMIIRTIYNEHKFKILKGWTLKHYRLRSGLPLEIELVSKNKERTQQYNNKRQQDIEQQSLLIKQQMTKIIQQNEQFQDDSLQVTHLVSKKYEELLHLIQNNNSEQYRKQIGAKEVSLGECQNQLYKKQLYEIQKELGINGFAAIHYAVLVGNVEIVNFLISIGADINIKSFDDWLPIQIAIDNNNMAMIDILIAQPNLNINICTARGLPLHMAVKSGNVSIVKKLLMRDVKFTAKDQLGQTVYDILELYPNDQISQALSLGKKRQSISFVITEKNIMYHTLITSFRGEVFRIKPPPFMNKQYYLCINPYDKVIKIYEGKKNYPDYPKQIIPINQNTKFQLLSRSQKSWYMKNSLTYFNISSSKHNKYILACHFEQTVNKWVSSYTECLKQIEQYPAISKLKRNDTDIIDRIQIQGKKKKTLAKNKDEIFTIFTSRNIEKTNDKENKKNCSLQLKNTQPSQKQKDQKQQNLSPAKISVFSPSKQWVNTDVVKFSDFNIIKKIGQGSFGSIFLALDLRNVGKQKHYALKTFKKVKLIKKRQIKYTMCQLNILKALSHPYIVNLHFTFQTLHYAYFGLDYCPKKDLCHHLMNEVTFPQNDAMIYTAEILSALEYLHEKHNIIYRDLKPENIMLDEQGHIKLIDFGLSKQGEQKNFLAKSFCGSPAYLSPEMLFKNGVRKQSDYYCLGTVLYQMIFGEPPFFANDIDTLYNNIKNSKLTFPRQVSQELQNLLVGLLERNPQKRLGYKGIQEIKCHRFFKNINWTAIQKRQIKAPVRQQIQNDEEDYTCVLQNIHKDSDYTQQNFRINRLQNFNFVREENKSC